MHDEVGGDNLVGDDQVPPLPSAVPTARAQASMVPWFFSIQEVRPPKLLKRFYREKGGRIRLQPANAAMAPLFVDERDLQIQGKVVAVYREV